MRAFSNDLRVRIHRACQEGESSAEVAERFGVCSAFVRRLEQRFRETGSLDPLDGRRGRKPLLAGNDERLRQAMRERPDATVAELREHLGLTASVTTLWRALRRLGYTFKKKTAGPPGRTAPK